MSKTPTLLHVLPSYYSAIARLLLVEKQVEFKSIILDMHIGLEYFEPWYVRLNPNVTVPTLIHGDVVMTSSVDMLDYVDEHFSGPLLKPASPDLREEMYHFLTLHHAIRIEHFTMGTGLSKSPFLQKKMTKTLKKQVLICEERAKRYPDLRTQYETKLNSVKEHLSDFNTEHLSKVRASGEKQVKDYLLVLERKLGEDPWLLGAQYTLCDIVNTSLYGRLCFIKRLDMLKALPKCDAYFKRLKARSSYQKAKIPDVFFPPHIIAAIFYRLFRKIGLSETPRLSSDKK